MFNDEDQTWCGYKDEALFQKISGEVQPLESARVVYDSGTISEITHQVQPDSGDWIIIDKYTFQGRETNLRRAFLFAQSGIQVIKEGKATGQKPIHLALLSAKNPDGSSASLNDVYLPTLPINSKPLDFIFVKLADSMKEKGRQKLCVQADAEGPRGTSAR
jgi:hypothetical protein